MERDTKNIISLGTRHFFTESGNPGSLESTVSVKTKTASTGLRSSKIRATQLKDLARSLNVAKHREMHKQEKRSRGKHLHDANIKVLDKAVNMLRQLLEQGYEVGRYQFKKEDFEYEKPVRKLTEEQRLAAMEALNRFRETKAGGDV